MKNIFKISVFFFIVFQLNLLAQKTTFFHIDAYSTKDKRLLYETMILKLALDKTIDKYGEYELKPIKRMTKSRAIATLKKHKIKNFILKISVTYDLLEELSYANFPIDRGVAGYRVSFISEKIKNDIKKFDTLEKIKKLKIGQGIGWLDTNILEYNNFNVKNVGSYEALFNLVSIGRIDLFPRGINEILSEYTLHKDIKNLDYDKTFILRYDFPRFFFANKLDSKAIKRIEEGLILAYKDGSLEKVFDKYYRKSIEFVNLNKRKIYDLENPFLKGIDKKYKQYNIKIIDY